MVYRRLYSSSHPFPRIVANPFFARSCQIFRQVSWRRLNRALTVDLDLRLSTLVSQSYESHDDNDRYLCSLITPSLLRDTPFSTSHIVSAFSP